jgi:hypothetical protein
MHKEMGKGRSAFAFSFFILGIVLMALARSLLKV